ncbi:hypothetical protein [Gloeobacter morelensis]|uniref:Transposase n=1 Tax=Gloeobacter morelensis MG652769 TaxID=2781736 RepID=A0ABY3PSM7_9CYAN|nr:hypothetical protein [Gloeobacter morelensis]UFP96487.1 hypothetical protein ISF26_09850 [Gloeobacter morelensis MG652769]
MEQPIQRERRAHRRYRWAERFERNACFEEDKRFRVHLAGVPEVLLQWLTSLQAAEAVLG